MEASFGVLRFIIRCSVQIGNKKLHRHRLFGCGGRNKFRFQDSGFARGRPSAPRHESGGSNGPRRTRGRPQNRPDAISAPTRPQGVLLQNRNALTPSAPHSSANSICSTRPLKSRAEKAPLLEVKYTITPSWGYRYRSFWMYGLPPLCVITSVPRLDFMRTQP